MRFEDNFRSIWYGSIKYIKRRKSIHLKPNKPSKGNVLYSYVVGKFLLNLDRPVSYWHTHFWEARQIVKTFLDLGYSVDAIWSGNRSFTPKKQYAFFIDCRSNLQRLTPKLNQDCIKIAHLDTAHMLFQDTAELKRLLNLQDRKGITLRPHRFQMPNLAIEHADCGVVLGNEFTISTYWYANKPIYRVPISSPMLYPWPEQKDFDGCRKRFLWLGSAGMVHKGLDLLLDAFVELPDYHLTICGPVERETAFEQAFYKELYQTSNINTIGWVDIGSDKFLEIANSCIGLVYPSCSEGGGGAVITCLHAGLIPIASFESSVDVSDDFGIILNHSSIEEIKDSVRKISKLPAEELKLMARKAWEFARANHTKERFAEEYKQVIEKIMTMPKNKRKTSKLNIERA